MADTTIDQVYAAYAQDPTPENLSSVVKALKPTIDFNIAQYGAMSDPLVRAKAMSFAADTVQKFKPTEGAALPTFLSSQLRQLSRATRQSRNPVQIPERVQLDAMKLNQARKEFFDKFDREPDTAELADFTSMPIRRIEKIRKFQVAIPSEAAMGDQQHAGPDYDREALDYVYNDSDHIDRRVMELKMGYAGHPVMAPNEVAIALNLTPTQLSRRAMRLAMRINKISSTLAS